MSVRNIRKLYGDNSLPPPEGNSDEEFEPLYAKSSSSRFKYQGLVLSSHSESEHESTDAVGIENASSDELSKKKKKKKKKQKKAKQVPKPSSNLEEMDEIDRSLMEVNAMLGAPAAVSKAPEPLPPDPVQELLAVQQKHLNVSNELKKMFGPEALAEEGGRRRGRQPNLTRILKRATIVPMPENTAHLQKSGLSMSIQRQDKGYTYFTFDHSKEYQRMHRAIVNNYRNGFLAESIEEAQRNLHVEGMLEAAESMYQYEAYTPASSLIEQIIAYMQYVAHPFFKLTDPKVRLEYRYAENRAFHIAVFQYMYLLTNRACHRTALELAKLLLNLDPSDPLAVLLVIDTLALRAREHQWLINVIEYWQLERDAEFLLNLQYSYAMSHFHVATKNKENLSHADELLKAAMLRFPGVVNKILENASIAPSTKVKESPLFQTAEETTGKALKEMIKLYAKLSWPKWREPAVLEWLQRNAAELADQFAADTQLQAKAKELAKMRQSLFRGFPAEVKRHLCIVKPMANLLFDGMTFHVNRTWSWNPVPPANGVSRYGYEPAVLTALQGNSPFYELFSSILPHYPQLAQERQMNDMLLDEINRAENELPAEVQEAQVVAAAVAAAAAGPGAAVAVAAGDGERPNTVQYIEAVTAAVLRFMNVYETGNDPDAEADDYPPNAENGDVLPLHNGHLDEENATRNTTEAHSSAHNQSCGSENQLPNGTDSQSQDNADNTNESSADRTLDRNMDNENRST